MNINKLNNNYIDYSYTTFPPSHTQKKMKHIKYKKKTLVQLIWSTCLEVSEFYGGIDEYSEILEVRQNYM